MSTEQLQHVILLQGNGWQVAGEQHGRIEMVHLSASSGAFSVTYVHRHGGFSWGGSYPLDRLPAMYPSFSTGIAA